MTQDDNPQVDPAIDPPSTQGGGTAPTPENEPTDDSGLAIDPPSTDGGTK